MKTIPHEDGAATCIYEVGDYVRARRTSNSGGIMGSDYHEGEWGRVIDPPYGSHIRVSFVGYSRMRDSFAQSTNMPVWDAEPFDPASNADWKKNLERCEEGPVRRYMKRLEFEGVVSVWSLVEKYKGPFMDLPSKDSLFEQLAFLNWRIKHDLLCEEAGIKHIGIIKGEEDMAWGFKPRHHVALANALISAAMNCGVPACLSPIRLCREYGVQGHLGKWALDNVRELLNSRGFDVCYQSTGFIVDAFPIQGRML